MILPRTHALIDRGPLLTWYWGRCAAAAGQPETRQMIEEIILDTCPRVLL